MKFTKALIKGKFVKRYKRFFADVKVNKSIITAHCPNTGSMMGLLNENNDAWVSRNDDPKRKLKFTLEILKSKNNLVGVNTVSPTLHVIDILSPVCVNIPGPIAITSAYPYSDSFAEIIIPDFVLDSSCFLFNKRWSPIGLIFITFSPLNDLIYYAKF